MSPVRLALLWWIASAVAAGPAIGQSLSLGGYALPLEGAELPRDALFARIDSLESQHHRSTGPARGRAALRLGELYLATDLDKHRRLALDYLEEAAALAPDESFDAARLRAVTAQEMGYPGDARKWMEGLVVRHPDDARPHELIGRLEFLQARGRMRMEAFARARDAFARAVAIDSTAVEAWYGLAACAVALGDPSSGRPAVAALGRLAPERTESLFLEGALALADGDPDRAHLVFTEALDRSDADLRAVYLDAVGFLEASDLEQLAVRVIERPVAQEALRRLGEDDPLGEDIDWSRALDDSLVRKRTLAAYWSGMNSRPTQAYNPQELEYWGRLVEADVLFGDPDAGLRGWARPTGAALVRWGRPTSTFHHAGTPGVGGSILDDLDHAGVRLLPGESVPSDLPVWVWTYRRPGIHFSLVFTDASFNELWSPGDASAWSIATYRKQMPLLFATPELPPSSLRLSVSRAIFPRGDDRAVLETLIGLRPTEDFLGVPADSTGDPDAALPTIEWALYDEQDRRLDYRVEKIREEHRRAWLHRALGRENGDGMLDPYVLPIGAVVPAGRYRLAVESWGPHRQGHDAIVLDVEVPASEPPTLLELSDLQLASAFAPYPPSSGIALRYVKFGQVIVPVPDLRLPAAASRVGVYFEVRNLVPDPGGLTRFDVSYEVFSSIREVRNLALVSDFERSDLDRIDPLTLVFLEERTGLSPEGLVVKGIELDIGTLSVGDYVLVVTVRDRIGERETSRAVSFRKRGD